MSYGWRDKLAEVAGFEIGRSANDERPLVLIDWGRITMDNIAGRWAEMPGGNAVTFRAWSRLAMP